MGAIRREDVTPEQAEALTEMVTGLRTGILSKCAAEQFGRPDLEGKEVQYTLEEGGQSWEIDGVFYQDRKIAGIASVGVDGIIPPKMSDEAALRVRDAFASQYSTHSVDCDGERIQAHCLSEEAGMRLPYTFGCEGQLFPVVVMVGPEGSAVRLERPEG